MALCVLLADESATIKKVMQITLQDFDADIRCVSLGTDVASVAKQFKPDIIFIDILLQKKSGYEVAKDLKNNPDCQSIPIIMLWNSFMEFDEEKFKASQADDKLEKPFDTQSLREIITKYVPKVQSSPIAEHIEPPPIEWKEDSKTIDDEATNALPLNHKIPNEKPEEMPPEQEKEEDSWTMDSFEDLPSLDQMKNDLKEDTVVDSEEDSEEDQFQPLKLDELPDEKKAAEESISRFTLNLPKEDLDDLEVDDNDDEAIDTSNFLWGNEATSTEGEDNKENVDEPKKETLSNIEPSKHTNEVAEKITDTTERLSQAAEEKGGAKISDAELEAYVREHCQETIEKLAREMVPELAKQMIQKEIDRLLKEEADA